MLYSMLKTVCYVASATKGNMTMRNLKRSLQLLVVTALLALPVVAVSAQSGTVGDPYVWDGASDWPGVTSVIVAPEELPQTGNSGGIYVPPNLPAPGETELTVGELEASAGSPTDAYTEDDRALLAVEPWGEQAPEALPVTGNSGGIYVPPNLPAPGETELTIGEAALSSMAETESGDIWVASNPTTSEPAPAALPETGSSKIPEPAIKEWRFDGYTLVPDWADTAEPEAMTGVASEPPLALPVTGSTEQTGTTGGGFVWDGMTYVPDVVSEPPLALPATGNSGVRSSLNGAYNEEFTQPSDVGAPGPYVGLPVTGVNPND
jgi:hypothetical protein